MTSIKVNGHCVRPQSHPLERPETAGPLCLEQPAPSYSDVQSSSNSSFADAVPGAAVFAWAWRLTNLYSNWL